MPRLSIKLILLFLVWLSPCHVYGQVSAGFTVDNASGCTPLIVHFTNTSTDALSYSWNLGNSTTTTAVNPSASYIAAGTYTVTLTAINGAATSTHSMVITVYPLPVVNFNADMLNVCPGVPVSFTNTSSAGTPGPVSYTWNFGDGSTSGAPTPTYTHALPGLYNITLFVTNSMGCGQSLTKPNYIRVYNPPVAGFSGSGTYICSPPSAVSFSNSSTGTPPLSFNWSFGDGAAPSVLVNPTHSYSLVGSHNVRLRVTDGNGCIDSLVNPGYVYVGDLSASFSAPLSICQYDAVPFSNTSSPHITRYWELGDGFTSTDEEAAHAYSAPGTYTVTLVVSDGMCYDTVSQPITVNPVPTASFTISPTHPCPPPVSISYTATMPPGCTASWKFMDNLTGTGATVSHLYSTYTAIDTNVLTVTSSFGCKKVVEKADTTYRLSVSIEANAQFGCIPATTIFTPTARVESYNPLTGEYIPLPFPYVVSNYSWNFGDGSGTVTGPMPSHTYTAVGSYLVTCTMTTTTGCVKTGNMTVRYGVPPVVSFTATPTPVRICAGKTVLLSSSGSSTINSHYWKYGDGTVDSGVSFTNTSHRYPNPIQDTIRLRGYHNGCPSPEVKMPIIVDSPNAVPSHEYTCVPRNRVVFGDGSVGADSRLWIFGDGDTSSAAIVSHDFPSLSNFDVRLTTYNAASGCRDTVHTEIKLGPPFMYFAAADDKVCIHEETPFYPFVIGPPDAVHYRWYIDGALTADTSAANINLPFHTQGLHDVMLEIVDDRGCLDTFTRYDYVLTGNPVADFSSVPPSGCGPLTVNFVDLSTGIPEVPLDGYEWNFGDASPPFVSSSPGAAHTFIAPGAYDVTLTVTDTLDCVSTTTPRVMNVYRPHAAFYADANNVCHGESVHFNNLSVGIVSSFWMFGDGNTATTTSPYHVYSASGVYTVRLAVTDIHGCIDTATLLNYIYVAPSPVAAFTMSDSFAVCPPLNVSFTNTSTSAVSYNWNFGNSTSSVATHPSSPYTLPGYYPVRLVAFNSIGCSDTAIRHVNIFGYSGAFSYTPTAGCMPLSSHFSVTLGTIASMVWDFGDGVTSSVSLVDTISHTYPTPGMYVPKLILTDTSGCTNFSIGSDTIKVDIVTPHFRRNPNPVCQGSPITFTDSSYANFGPPSSWSWSFGSGATATGYSPTHVFTLPGTYAVTLAVTNVNGCTASVTRSVTVNPIPDPIAGTFSVCRGATTSLTNATPGGVWTSSVPGVATVSSSGLVSGVSAGTSKISYNLSAGCIAVATVTVHPVPAAISGTNVICAGTNTNFVTSTTGGTWTSSFPLIGSVNPTSGIVSGLAAGTSKISYTLSSGCFATRDITVNAVPAAITGTTTVCKNFTTTLSQSMTGGMWISGNPAAGTISAAGVVTGIDAGTTIITYASAAGCRATTIVTVYALPAPITGSNVICAGSTTSFASATTGGTWSSSFPLIGSVNATSGLVSGLSAGTSNITYTLGSGCTTTRDITVNLVPAAITGTTAVCENSSTTLYQSLTGGTWSSGNPAAGTIDAGGVVTGIAAGTTEITYAFSTGCMATKIVTVNELPDTITGTATLCNGGITALANSTPGGVWSSAHPSFAVVHPSIGTVFGMAVGTALISYSMGSGCATTKVVTINVIPAPITGPLVLCQDATVTLSESVPGGTWSSGNDPVATIDATGLVTGISGGTARITYAFATGCLVTTVVTVQPLPDTISGSPGICFGVNAYLYNSTPGGTWSSSDPSVAPITSAGLIIPATYGTAIISYTLPTGCKRGVVVTVNPVPAAITGTTNVCVGIPTMLHNATPGGTWSSGNPGVVEIGLLSGVYNGVSSGTATITYTSPFGCIAMTTLTVEALPPVINGGPTVCAGFAINLTNTMPGGVWSSDPSSAGTLNTTTGVVSGIMPGTVSVSYTIMTGCTRNLVVTVLVLPPVISGSPNVCIGEETLLSNATLGGTWSSSNPARATVDAVSGAVWGISAGPAVITYKVASGCFTILHINVNPLPSPIIGPSTVCEGSSVLYSSSPSSGIWISDHTDTATVGFTSGVVTGVLAGTATISYSLATGCKVTKLINVRPTPPAITGNPHVCIGTSEALGNSMGGGVWLSGNNSVATIDPATGLVTSVSLGTSVISYIIPSTGCYATLIVTVHPLPVVYNVTGGGNYCSGGIGVPVGLSGSQPGVSYVLYYGSSATGYLPGSGFTLDFGAMTAAGVYTVHATDVVSGCTRHMAGSATVAITPLVTPAVTIAVTPDDTLCPGSTITVTPVTVNGGTAPVYEWRVNGAIVSGSPAYSFLPANGDTVSVVMTGNVSCPAVPTATASRVLTVLPPAMPVVDVLVSPGDTICQFSPATFSAIPSFGGPGPAYTWRVNGLIVGTGTVYHYVPQHGDVVNCAMTSDYLCRLATTVSSGDINMVIDSMTLPIVAITATPGLSVTTGTPVTLSTSVSNAGAIPLYQWKVNGAAVPGATLSTYTAVFSNQDSVVCVVTGKGICDGVMSFDWVFISVNPLWVQQVSAEMADIKLVPNPNKGNFTISGTLGNTVNETVAIAITDMLGQSIYKSPVVAGSGKINESFTLGNNLANGMYMLTLDWSGGRKVFHFVIEQ